MYVVRVGKDGRFKESKPCIECQAEIEKYGVRRVFFSWMCQPE
jgi:hypothetical protein